MKHKRCYSVLKTYGFSPAHALRIVIDCRRGDAYALAVLRIARRASH